MIVVSDASPLHYLVLIGHEAVLPLLFGEVFVPPAVLQELDHPRTPSIVRAWVSARPAWLQLRKPTALDPTVKLDPGEREAIALAEELRADALLIDDRRGRLVAKRRRLATYGTLAVLEIAATKDEGVA